jgi:hypothetical protein
MPEDMPDRMPKDLPDRMPEDMSEVPEHMPEDMSDRMPEDLLVRKYINVMVGIIRNKIIISDRYLYFLDDLEILKDSRGIF